MTGGDQNKLWYAAYHEAAHAVISHALGEEVVEIYLDPQSDRLDLGGCTVNHPEWCNSLPYTLSEDQISYLKNYLISTCAGVEGENLYSNDAEYRSKGGGSDDELFIGIAKRITRGKNERGRLLYDSRVTARKMVCNELAAQIHAIANRLVNKPTEQEGERRRLVFEDMKDIMTFSRSGYSNEAHPSKGEAGNNDGVED